MRQASISLNDTDLVWLVKNSPVMRSTALQHLSFSPSANASFTDILTVINSGYFIDDESFVETSKFLLHADFTIDAAFLDEIRRFCGLCSTFSDVTLQSAILVAIRFLPDEELFAFLKDHRNRISNDFWLARAASGATCRLYGNPRLWDDYKAFIDAIQNDDANSVMSFLLYLADSPNYDQATISYLKNKNPTFPNGVYFPKWICIQAAKINANGKI